MHPDHIDGIKSAVREREWCRTHGEPSTMEAIADSLTRPTPSDNTPRPHDWGQPIEGLPSENGYYPDQYRRIAVFSPDWVTGIDFVLRLALYERTGQMLWHIRCVGEDSENPFGSARTLRYEVAAPPTVGGAASATIWCIRFSGSVAEVRDCYRSFLAAVDAAEKKEVSPIPLWLRCQMGLSDEEIKTLSAAGAIEPAKWRVVGSR